MNKGFFFLLFFLIVGAESSAQIQPDSISVADTSIIVDSTILKPVVSIKARQHAISKKPKEQENWPINSINQPGYSWQVLQRHPFFGFGSTILKNDQQNIRYVKGKESFFYFTVMLFLLFAALRQIFPKYFSDLFRLFFRTTLKQRQIREQLMQTPLPSLLLNGFYILSGGLYVSLLFKHFDINPLENFWLMFFYCCIGLSAVYFVKFVFLKMAGWVFSATEAANAYIFIVFIINKMIGIMLLPFIAILAFSVGNVYTAGLVISWCLIAGLILYRFILTYASVRNQVKVNPFHFFLYLCAFEIAPLLLIYKALLLFLSRSA